MGVRRWLAALGDQVLTVVLYILGTDSPGVDGVFGAPDDARGELAAVAADRVNRGVAVGDVQAQQDVAI